LYFNRAKKILKKRKVTKMWHGICKLLITQLYFEHFVKMWRKQILGKETKMYLKESKANQIAGIFFFVLGLVLAFIIVPSQIEDVTQRFDGVIVSARFFPRVFSIFMSIMGVLLFRQGCREKKKTVQGEIGVSKQGIKLILITFAVLIAYVLLLYFLPYMAATIPVLALLIWIYGQRNPVKIIGVAVGVPVLFGTGVAAAG